MTPENTAIFAPPLRAAIEGRSSSLETMFNGHWFSVNVLPILDDDGNVILGMAMSQMITERKRTEAQLRQYATRAEMLTEMSLVLSTATHDTPSVLQLVVKRIAEVLGDGATVALLSEDGKRLNHVAYHHRDPATLALTSALFEQHTIQLEDPGPFATTARTGEPVLMPQVSLDELFPKLSTQQRAFIERTGMHSFIVVPLCIQNDVVGILALIRDKTPAAYTEDDRVLVEELADRAGIALGSARLFEALQRELVERRHTEAALALSEDNYRTLLEQAGDAIAVADLSGKYVLVNRKACELLGYSRDEIADDDDRRCDGAGGRSSPTVENWRTCRRQDVAIRTAIPAQRWHDYVC